MCRLNAQKLTQESEEQRYQRLEDMRNRDAQRQTQESKEQRNQRLQDMRHRISQI